MMLLSVLLLLLAGIIMWLGPIFIAYCNDNWWLVLLYIVWWMPASVITVIIANLARLILGD